MLKDIIASIRRGLKRPEVRRHPIRAIARRISWRLYWKNPDHEHILIDDWWRGMRIALPNTTNSSLLYYRKHSDINLVKLMEMLIYPNMICMDVGAHIGEFTLIASKLTGKNGKVISIEPLPPCAEAIRNNSKINHIENIEVHNCALSDFTGKIGFHSDTNKTAGWIATANDHSEFEVACWKLDDFLDKFEVSTVDLVKLDAGGNELSALRGATKSLASGRIKTMVMKLYNPTVTIERFSYDSHETIKLLLEWGWRLKLMIDLSAYDISESKDIDQHFGDLIYTHTLVAIR